MRRSSGVAIGVALLACGLAGDAAAYCRTSYCPMDNATAQVCDPAQPDDCGIPLAWGKPCVEYDIAMQASKEVSLATAENVFATAFANWMNADCGNGAHPDMSVQYFGPVDCDKHEYNQDAGNANIILFRDDGWPYQDPNAVLALTTVTYDLDTGEIYDADIELNSANIQFTTTDTNVGYDLYSIAQHETGHFLGLAHSHDPTATMFAKYTPGSTDLRTLAADDMAAICAVYPPAAPDPSCDPTPRHGFSSECGADQPAQTTGGCCTVAPGSERGDGAGAIGLLCVAAAAIAKRRRA